MAEQPHPDKLGRYIVVKEIGKGAMGVVYEGYDPNIGRRVAIKTARREMLEASGREEELLERFLREARAAGSLNHPNVVTIYDAGEESGLAYIAMEYLNGGTLADVLNAKKRLDPGEAAEVCAVICDGLAAAHDKGIVHRDVKPANIMMLPGGAIKVGDFGIAHVSDSTLTHEGSMFGTPYFMSPEQFMGQKVDARSDLFAVGIICYELLTGEKPFTGESLSTVMHSVLKVTPIEPCELNYAVKRCLSRVVMKALNKEPGRRYQDARAMAAALRECAKESPDASILSLSSDHWESEATVVTHAAPAETVVLGNAAATGAPARPTPIPAPAPRPAETPRAASRKGVYAAIALVLALGGTGAYWRMTHSVPPSLPQAAADGENSYGVVDFNFYLAPTPEAEQQLMRGEPCPSCLPEQRGDIRIEAFDAHGRTLTGEDGKPWGFVASGVTGGRVRDLPPGTRSVKLTWRKEGMFENHMTKDNPSRAGEPLIVELPLLPKAALDR